jgi:hypothetical protein
MKNKSIYVTTFIVSAFWVFILSLRVSQEKYMGVRIFINESDKVLFRAQSGDTSAKMYIHALIQNADSFSYDEIRKYISALPDFK